MKIKLTNIAPTDIKGGASLAGYNLHKEFLKSSEIDSVILVDEKYSKDQEVIKFSNFFLRQAERFFNKFGYFTGLQYLFSVNWLSLAFKKRTKETDIFLIRNIHGGMFPFYLPWYLNRFAPVIWRLPDMWAFTGHCAYSYECEKWKTKCKKCPHLRDYPGLFIDTTPFLFSLKKFFYKRARLFMVAPSLWMQNNIKQSPILSRFPCYHIPVGVDTEFFKPDIKSEKPTLLITSSSLKDKRKGGEILPSILALLNEKLKEKNIKADILWLGKNNIVIPEFSNLNYVFLGEVGFSDMPKYFSKAHLHLLPTLADNLPNTILESSACQTPVVVFDVGGCSEVALHKQTGYLAKSSDIDDFVQGILFFLSQPEYLAEAGKKARAFILRKFSQQKQADAYTALIKSILSEKQKR